MTPQCTIIGVGAVGSRAAHLLVQWGVHNLTLIDPDIVREHNSSGHFSTADVGRRKVDVIREQLLEKEPGARIRTHATYLTGMNTKLIDTDVLLDGSDNLETRFLLNEIAHKEGVPCVFCAVGDEHALLYMMDGTPCLACFSGTRSTSGCEMSTRLAARAARLQVELLTAFLQHGASPELVMLGEREERYPVQPDRGCEICAGLYRRIGSEALTVCRSQRVCKVFARTDHLLFGERLVDGVPVLVIPGGLEIGTMEIDLARRVAEQILRQ